MAKQIEDLMVWYKADKPQLTMLQTVDWDFSSPLATLQDFMKSTALLLLPMMVQNSLWRGIAVSATLKYLDWTKPKDGEEDPFHSTLRTCIAGYKTIEKLSSGSDDDDERVKPDEQTNDKGVIGRATREVCGLFNRAFGEKGNTTPAPDLSDDNAHTVETMPDQVTIDLEAESSKLVRDSVNSPQKGDGSKSPLLVLWETITRKFRACRKEKEPCYFDVTNEVEPDMSIVDGPIKHQHSITQLATQLFEHF